MIVVAAFIQTKEGKGEEFEREFHKLGPKVRKDPGTVAYVLHRCVDDPNKFFFYEKYESRDTIKYHTSTPHFKEFFQTVGPIMVGPPQITLYEEII